MLRSVRELAEFLGQPRATVGGWLKHEAWAFERKAPWAAGDKAEMLRWAASNLERGRLASGGEGDKGTSKELRDEKLRQEIRKLRANADQAETALAKERGGLHDADPCEEERIRAHALVRTQMQNLAPQAGALAISHGMPHEAVPVFVRQLEELVSGALRHLAKQGDGWASDRRADAALASADA